MGWRTFHAHCKVYGSYVDVCVWVWVRGSEWVCGFYISDRHYTLHTDIGVLVRECIFQELLGGVFVFFLLTGTQYTLSLTDGNGKEKETQLCNILRLPRPHPLTITNS